MNKCLNKCLLTLVKGIHNNINISLIESMCQSHFVTLLKQIKHDHRNNSPLFVNQGNKVTIKGC